MVVVAGYNPYNGILELYDSEQWPSTQTITTMKLADVDIDKIFDLFEDIKKQYNKNIYLLCIKVGCKYKNKFRKKFIKVAGFFNIPLVKFIGRQTALLQGSLIYLPVYREHEDIVWIFDVVKKWIYCNIWERRINDIWKFKGCFRHEKLDFVRPVDLQALKQKLNPSFKNPFIFVCCGEYNLQEHEKLEFQKVLANSKETYFASAFEWSKWALNYGRHLVRNPVVCQLLLERQISISIGDIKIIEKGYFHYIPLKSSIKVPIDRVNLKLKVSEDNVNTKKIIFGTQGIVEITLNVDENGIFSVNSGYCQNVIKEDESQVDYDSLITSVQQATIEAMHEKHKKYYNMPPKNAGHYRKSNAVGIDFGTTQCCAAVIRSGGPDCVVLDLVTSARTMPSYIGYDENEPKCGQIVCNRMRQHKKCTVYDTKRMLGKSYDEIAIDPTWPFTVKKLVDNSCQIILKKEKESITLSPEEVSSSLLKHIKTKLDEYQQKNLKEAVIAIPSAFTEKQKCSLLKTANLAGWDIIHFIPEPIAAAFAYSMEMDIPNHSKLLLFDFGGGTIDVCIVHITAGNLQVLSFDGNYYLGGRDFDTLLYNHFAGILKHKHNIDVSATNKKYLLLQKCQEIKHTLSVTERLDVSHFSSENDEVINITNEEFNSMAANNITQISDVILNALKTAHLRSNEINYVVQVGGSSRMPMIKKFLSEMFPNSIHKCSNKPDWTIAEGAALYAYYLEQEDK